MKILYDHQIFSHQTTGGISRCFVDLMLELEQSGRAEFVMPILFSNNVYIRQLKSIRPCRFMPKWQFRGKNRIILKINDLYNNLKLACNLDYDIYHATSDGTSFLSFLAGRPFVMTIHDMIQEEMPEAIPGAPRYVDSRRYLAEKAAAIVTPSAFTKQRLLEKYKFIPAENVRVVHHAPPPLVEAIKGRIKAEKFFLYVGHRIAYKNFPFLLKSFAMFRNEFSDYRLLCAGGGAFNEMEIKLIDSLKLGSFVSQLGMTDNELAYAYSNAAAYICPSKLEGFGIPVLEAFSYSCPALLAEASSLPEVAGNAAAFFDPEKPETLLELMKKTIKENDFRTALIQRGKERLKDFSAAQNADQMIEAYKYAMDKSGKRKRL